MSCPIVFIHQGAPAGFHYLNYAVMQVRWWSPRTPVVVIADQACRSSLVVPGLELVEIDAVVLDRAAQPMPSRSIRLNGLTILISPLQATAGRANGWSLIMTPVED